MTKEECEIETSKAIMEMRNQIAELEKENAELKEPKTRRMTHKELAHWLREKPTREWKYKNGVTVYGYYGYEEKVARTTCEGRRMTIEEIKQKTSLCFLLNPNISEEEKICVIEKVMATKATIVPKAALCNIITYILKQNAKLKSKNCTQAGRS